MDFLEINKQLAKKKNEPSLCVQEATESIRERIDIEPIIQAGEAHEITCEEDAKQALSMSMQARKLRKTLEESRTKIIKPHLDFQRAVNQLVKDYTAKLEQIEQRLKGKLEAWLDAQSSFENNFTNLLMEVDDGVATKKSTWEFEIEDFSKIPREYLTLDEKKVKDKIKKGIREISGLRIYEKNNLTMRVKND